MCDSVWREVVGLRPKRPVPPDVTHQPTPSERET